MKRTLLSKCVAECIGTFALVFAGCGSIMVSTQFDLSPTMIPLVFGLVVSSMIYAVGHISGAHLNPAVTLGFAITRHFPKNQILPYCLSQYSGGILAITILAILLPGAESFGATMPAISFWRGFLWEMILTFFLMFVIVSVATDTRAVGMMAGVAIGGTVTLCALFGGPLTGASMNPARTFAPNLFQGEMNIVWLYTLAPVLGACIAAKTYEWIRCDLDTSEIDNEDSKNAEGCC